MSARLEVGVVGLGLLGPGWADWPTARPHLLKPDTWQRVPTVVPPPASSWLHRT